MFAILLFFQTLVLDVPPVNTACICEKAKVSDGWCDVCAMGYVAGLRIPSKLFFTTIDHGHEVDAREIRCASCREAMKEDGFCEACQMGFFKGKLYFSRFTQLLAMGERIRKENIGCAQCRRHVDEGGWCESCKRGIFGNVAITHSLHFEEAVNAFRRLKNGLAHLEVCELCAIAMYSNGMCPKCVRIFRDGKQTSPK